ncbi:DUF2249 domain-containing protein [Lentibacillus sp. CBA3610]|uniref:DUF2249 domain-containing protein n=1 Tax=Lentibacillus sp. CBA3610 TaxID=2518176 RepID=UPI0015962553|nr:DUF2249 domain-containing protein [Lentibacillus sp. CBA3610]QKY68592.1 DUF2249 domain-containing protein [Lentibacillus sp. CBA3610]
MQKQENIVELDVREDLAMKKEPFDKIMGTVKSLNDGEAFILHAPFNPLPLHKILKRRGFVYETEKIAKKHWKVTYTKKEGDEE